ncbi:MAG: hypothetical protein AAF998_12185 [Bacteroidota bacterium]
MMKEFLMGGFPIRECPVFDFELMAPGCLLVGEGQLKIAYSVLWKSEIACSTHCKSAIKPPPRGAQTDKFEGGYGRN